MVEKIDRQAKKVSCKPDSSLGFWLKKRGKGTFVTYRGGAAKAILYIEIPLDEIAAFYHVTELSIGEKVYKKVDRR